MPDQFKTETVQQKMLSKFMERSYKIGRNDPCPCGSGQKFKKCCDRIKPKKRLDIYLEEIAEENNEYERKELIDKALEDYPFEPTLLFMASISCLITGDKENILEYLLTLWEIVRLDLEETYIYLLTGILMDNNQFDEAGLILKEVEQKNNDSIGDFPDLLMNYARYHLHIGEYSTGLDYIEKANQRYPDDEYVRDNSIRFLISDEKMFFIGLKYWYDRFEEFDYENPDDFVEYLVESLLDNFNQDREEYNVGEIKTYLKLYINVYELKMEIQPLVEKGKIDKAIKLIDKIIENLPEGSLLQLEVLSEYAELEAWDSIVNKGKGLNNFVQDPFYNLLICKGYYFTGREEKALTYAKRAYDHSVKEEDIDEQTKVEITAYYLLILSALEIETDLNELLKQLSREESSFFGKLKKRIPEVGIEEKLLDIFQYISISDIFIIFNYLKDMELCIISNEKLYLVILDALYNYFNVEDNDIITEKLNQIEDWRVTSGISKSIIAEFIQLLVNKKNMNDKDFTQKINEIDIKKADDKLEYIVSIETILRYGDPEVILNLEMEGSKIPEEMFSFFQIIAHIKLGKFKDIMDNYTQIEIISCISTDIEIYVSDKDLLAFTDELGVDRKAFEQLKDLRSLIY